MTKDIAEMRLRAKEEKERRQNVLRESFVRQLPESARAFYIHASHSFRDYTGELIESMQKHYGKNNVLTTYAPAISGQSFTDFNESIEDEKVSRLTKPFKDFSAQRSIDAIIYLCDFVCDGYQDPIFPDSVQTKFHIWHAIRLAEQHYKPLIVGYQNDYCFRVSCPESDYITNREKIRCSTKLIRVPH